MSNTLSSLRALWQGTKAEDYTTTDLLRTDCDDLAALHAESFARPWTGGEFEKLIADDAVLALGLRKGQAAPPVAFLLIRSVPVAGEAEILTLIVAKSKQRRGLGFKLLDEGLRRLKLDGLESLFLEVDETNISARKLYERLGFEQVGLRPGYYTSGADEDASPSNALVMELKLR